MTEPDWTNDAPEAIGEALADKHLRIIKEAVTMTDDRLTDDDLAAIAARFEELINLGISGHTDTWKRQKLLAMEMSENDVPRLLAHIRAQDAEIARLRDALAALVGPGAVGYRDWFPDDMGRDGCTYCDYEWETGQPERHAPDCPIAACRALLDGGA